MIGVRRLFRLAIEFIKPGMILARNVYDVDGRVILAAGATLSPRYINILAKWGIETLYIDDPTLELPLIDEAFEESVRRKAVKTAKTLFNDVTKKGVFSLSKNHKVLLNDIVKEVLDTKSVILHLAQITRHKTDIHTHSVNVAILSAMTAIALGYRDRKDLFAIVVGALLHDIGMVLIPKQIILKEYPSQEDLELIKEHTKYGFELLRRTYGFPLMAAHVALQHHEHFDGTGYPRKLSGDGIIKFARIVSLANEYDNMIGGRLDIHSVPAHIAYERIAASVNSVFDPEVAEGFLSRIALYPLGTFVRLTTEAIGIVTHMTPRLQHRPRIKMIIDENQRRLEVPFEIDLAEQAYQTIFIKTVLTDKEVVSILGKEDVS
jgi:putative nucleotidyltransferase with HDIG domain